ncbi:MAG: hypothetical protein ACTS1X_04455 [Parasphingopyxis sp.]
MPHHRAAMASVSSKISDGLSPDIIAAIGKARASLAAFVDRFGAQVGGIARPWTVPFPDGSVLTSDEFEHVWNRLHFLVVGDAFGPGYGGVFDYASKLSTIRYSTVLGWGAHPGGLEFIALHEVIHGCEAGDAVRRAQWDAYRTHRKAMLGRARRATAKREAAWASEYHAYPQFAEVEEFCNLGARSVADHFQLPPLIAIPTHGFEYGDLTR